MLQLYWLWTVQPSSFMLPPHYCGLGAGSSPFRAIVNKKQCETRVLFMLLVIHYWIWDVQDSQGVSASEMTSIVWNGALNSTHSLALHLKGWRRKELTLSAWRSCAFVYQHLWPFGNVVDPASLRRPSYTVPAAVQAACFCFLVRCGQIKPSFEILSFPEGSADNAKVKMAALVNSRAKKYGKRRIK